MESFWSIVSGWNPFWQGIFLLIVIGGVFTLIRSLARYAAVCVHGWPPEGDFPDEDEDEEF